MGKALGLNEQLIVSLVPRSMTVPVESNIEANGGLFPSPVDDRSDRDIGSHARYSASKLFRLKDGSGGLIGTSTHAVGTAKAMEMGELQGAMSGLAMGLQLW